MFVTITIQQLRDANACSDGVADFYRQFGQQVTLSWGKSDVENLLREDHLARRWLGWLIRKELVPKDTVCGCDLRGIDFSNTEWREVDFTGAKLSGARFCYADLWWAYFCGCDLSGTDFDYATMDGVTFVGSDITTARFRSTELYGVVVTEEQRRFLGVSQRRQP